MLNYGPSPFIADHFKLFYDFSMVWSFKISARRAAVASDFIWLGDRPVRVQLYDSCDTPVGAARLVDGTDENHAGSGHAAGVCAFYDFSV